MCYELYRATGLPWETANKQLRMLHCNWGLNVRSRKTDTLKTFPFCAFGSLKRKEILESQKNWDKGLI